MEESKIKSLDFNVFNPSKFLFLTVIYMVSYYVGTIFFGSAIVNPILLHRNDTDYQNNGECAKSDGEI